MTHDSSSSSDRRNIRRYGIHLADLDRGHTASHGIINFALSAAESLAHRLDPDERLVLFVTDAIVTELGTDATDLAEVHVLPSLTGPFRRVVRDQWGIVRATRSDKVDVLWFPKGILPVAGLGRQRTVATVHDDIAMQYVARRYGWRAITPGHLYAALGTRRALARADAVTTVTEHASEVLARRTRRARNIAITPSAALTVHASSTVKTRGFVLFGSAWPHKRIDQALRWCDRYNEATPNPLDITLIGGPAPADHVCEHLTDLSNDDVARVVQSSRVLVFMSELEGFGLPPVESWVAGTPSVWPNIRPMADTLTGVAGSFDPASFESFAAAVDQVRSLTVAEVEHFAELLAERFSPDRQGAALLEVFRSAVAQSLTRRR